MVSRELKGPSVRESKKPSVMESKEPSQKGLELVDGKLKREQMAPNLDCRQIEAAQVLEKTGLCRTLDCFACPCRVHQTVSQGALMQQITS